MCRSVQMSMRQTQPPVTRHDRHGGPSDALTAALRTELSLCHFQGSAIIPPVSSSCCCLRGTESRSHPDAGCRDLRGQQVWGSASPEPASRGIDRLVPPVYP